MSKVSSSVRAAWRKLGLTAVVAVLALVGLAGPAAAQGKASGTYLTEAFNRVTNNAALAANLNGYGYIDGTSIMAAWISVGGKATFNMQLDAGVEYVFLGAGDLDAQDVDLAIRDGNNNIVAEDKRVAADAVVVYKPQFTARYTMELILFKARNNVPCVCAAVIMRKGGRQLTLRNLDEAVTNLVGTLTRADNELKTKLNKRLDLHREKGQWAMFGAVLDKGQTTDVYNLGLGTGLRAFFATGDSRALDVDLFLMNNDGTQTIKEDVRTDRDASFVHQPGPGLHRLRIRNYDSNGPSICMMGVFDIVD